MGQPDTGRSLRIGETTNTIDAAVEAWLSNLAARGKRPGTIRSYRTLLKSAAPELRWATVADITAESVMEWAGAKRRAGAWTGTTMNRNTGALQSLSRFLHKKRWLATDPLTVIDRAEDDGGDGARAATTDEARALIRHAWERQQIDRRAVGNRALVWHCMFTMGLRASEPGNFTWKALFLDESVPFVAWTRQMHKSFRPCEVAVCEETACLLRLHRATVPHAADDQVFPTLPPRVTFRKDRDAAGVAAYDRRGRGFSPHSARKWFAHTLTVAGVEGRVIDTLMRHSTGTPGRYPDLTVEDQARFVALLPKLWPGELSTAQVPLSQPQGQKDETGLKPIASTSRSGILTPATDQMNPTLTTTRSSLPAPQGIGSSLNLTVYRGGGACAELDSGPSGQFNPPVPFVNAEGRTPPVDSTSPIIGAMVDELARRLRGGGA